MSRLNAALSLTARIDRVTIAQRDEQIGQAAGDLLHRQIRNEIPFGQAQSRCRDPRSVTTSPNTGFSCVIHAKRRALPLHSRSTGTGPMLRPNTKRECLAQ